MKIGLIGNPNVGKSTIFNLLTDSSQKIGNFERVTFDEQGAVCSFDRNIKLYDLPGIYSVFSISNAFNEEKLTENFILKEDYDYLINVVDSRNIKLNLYLTLQLIELQIPIILVINMSDIKEKSLSLDIQQFSKKFGIKVIETSATNNTNIDKLKRILSNYVPKKPKQPKYISKLNKISEPISNLIPKTSILSRNTISTYLLEGKENIISLFNIKEEVRNQLSIIRSQSKKDILISNTKHRMDHIDDLLIRKKSGKISKLTKYLDTIFLNTYLGPITFFSIIYFTLFLTLKLGSLPGEFFETLFSEKLYNLLDMTISNYGIKNEYMSLLLESICNGIGTVASFTPIIFVLYSILSILEESGYIGRATFIFDNVFSKLSLPGRAILPIFMGFGCNVPAIMGTRILEKEHEKFITTMMIPFISCSARFSVYIYLITCFNIQYGYNIIFLLYVLGIVVAVLTALILKVLLPKSTPSPLLMILPRYQLPRLKHIMYNSYVRTKVFSFGAGKSIFIAFTIFFILFNINTKLEVVNEPKHSILHDVGSAVAPIFRPIGAETAGETVGILVGIFAKELVTSAIKSYPSNHNKALVPTISYMIFLLLYFPCISVFFVMRETVGTKWSIIMLVYSTGIGYTLSAILKYLFT